MKLLTEKNLSLGDLVKKLKLFKVKHISLFDKIGNVIMDIDSFKKILITGSGFAIIGINESFYMSVDKAKILKVESTDDIFGGEPIRYQITTKALNIIEITLDV